MFYLYMFIGILWGFPGGSVVMNLPVNAGDAGDMGLILGSERASGGGNGNPFQCFCLENLMDREAWRLSPWVHKRVEQDLAIEHSVVTQPAYYIHAVENFPFTLN